MRAAAFIALVSMPSAFAQMTQSYRDAIVADHNQMKRDEIDYVQANPSNGAGMGAPTACLEYEYDTLLEQVAQNYLASLPSGGWQSSSFSHNSARTSDYAALGGSGYVGENWYSGGPTSATNAWCYYEWSGCSEKDAYFGLCSTSTGHYTQVIWDDSYKVGCGYLSQWGTLCNYSPGGNYNGQKPFQPSGTVCSACPSSHPNCDNELCTSGSGGANNCPASGSWPETSPGSTASIACDSGYSGSQTRSCDSNGNWGSVNTSGCSLLQCSATGVWPTTNAGSTATVACESGYTGNRTRFCNASGNWETVNTSNCVAAPTQCPAEGGWPATSASTTATLPCGTGYTGNQRRWCSSTGTWGTVNTSNCVVDPNADCSGNDFPSTSSLETLLADLEAALAPYAS